MPEMSAETLQIMDGFISIQWILQLDAFVEIIAGIYPHLCTKLIDLI